MISIATPTSFTLGNDDYEFRVQKVNADDTVTTVYTGKAYRRPGETSSVVEVNDICAAFLSSSDFEWANNTEKACPVSQTFWLQKKVSGTWTTVGSDFMFLNSWNGATALEWSEGLCRFIPGQPLRLTSTGGGTTWEWKRVNTDGTRDSDYTVITMTADGVYCMKVTPATGKTLASLLVNEDGQEDYSWQADNCARYGLAFVNASGRWETFVPQFNAARSRTQSHTSLVAHDGKRDIRVDITESLVFRSGFLTDAQSEAFTQLLDSPHIMLYDKTSGTESRVTIEDTTYEVKEFQNGRALVNYEFTVVRSESTERR